MPHSTEPVNYNRSSITSMLDEATEITKVLVTDADIMWNQFNRISNKNEPWYEGKRLREGGSGLFENILSFIKKMLFPFRSGGGKE